jgi:hypothetical protein
MRSSVNWIDRRRGALDGDAAVAEFVAAEDFTAEDAFLGLLGGGAAAGAGGFFFAGQTVRFYGLKGTKGAGDEGDVLVTDVLALRA